MMRTAAPALCLLVAAAPAALAAGPAPAGQAATLEVHIEVSGKEDGRAVRRTQHMVLRLRADKPTFANSLAEEPDPSTPAATAARQRRDARLEQRAAAARASLQQLDMDAIARACDRDQDSEACQAGRRAFASSIGQAEQLMQQTYADDTAGLETQSARYQGWHGLQTPAGGCGTVEAKVRDPGRPARVARLPSTAATAELETCFSTVIVDTHTGKLFFSLNPIQIVWQGGGHGDVVIDGADFGDGAVYDHLRNAVTIRGADRTGSTTYRSGRGTTVVRWSFQQH